MPGAPADVESEYPGEQGIPEVRNQSSEEQQQRDVNSEDAIFRELIVGVIRAIDRGHEMRIVEEKSEGIEGERPSLGGGRRNVVGQQKQWRAPGAAADRQIQPRTIDPRATRGAVGRGSRRDGNRG